MPLRRYGMAAFAVTFLAILLIGPHLLHRMEESIWPFSSSSTHNIHYIADDHSTARVKLEGLRITMASSTIDAIAVSNVAMIRKHPGSSHAIPAMADADDVSVGSAVDPRLDDLNAAWQTVRRWRVTDATTPNQACASALAKRDAGSHGDLPAAHVDRTTGHRTKNMHRSRPRDIDATSPVLGTLCAMEAESVVPQTRTVPKAVLVATPGEKGYHTRYIILWTIFHWSLSQPPEFDTPIASIHNIQRPVTSMPWLSWFIHLLLLSGCSQTVSQ